ncbi:MAG: Kae1-associated kinase Bud32 [Sulfolobales archaeon]
MERLTLLSKGAEAVIYKTIFMGIEAIVKYRDTKNYMDPRLDKLIRSKRTITEARIIRDLREKGVKVPAVLYMDPDNYFIVIEYIDGISLRDYLLGGGDPQKLVAAGEILGEIHKNNIYHGDPTISNYLIDPSGGTWIIDFGLSGYSEDIEEKAVDLHLAYRSIETLPFKDIVRYKKLFFEGYSSRYQEAEEISQRVEEIRRMGRYVAERKMRTVYKF